MPAGERAGGSPGAGGGSGSGGRDAAVGGSGADGADFGDGAGSGGGARPIPPGLARELIRERRAVVDARLAAIDARLTSVRAARADWSDEEHDPEGFALTHEWSSAEGTRRELLAELTELEAAERRVDAGVFGVCERCGEPIPVEQLRARPARRVHVACAGRDGARRRW